MWYNSMLSSEFVSGKVRACHQGIHFSPDVLSNVWEAWHNNSEAHFTSICYSILRRQSGLFLSQFHSPCNLFNSIRWTLTCHTPRKHSKVENCVKHRMDIKQTKMLILFKMGPLQVLNILYELSPYLVVMYNVENSQTFPSVRHYSCNHVVMEMTSHISMYRDDVSIADIVKKRCTYT